MVLPFTVFFVIHLISFQFAKIADLAKRVLAGIRHRPSPYRAKPASAPAIGVGLHPQGHAIKAHLDFMFAWDSPRPAIRILKLKSTERLPDTLYTSYEWQLYGQAGFMAQMWNRKAFTLRDSSGTILHQRLTMPELCKAHFCLHLLKDPAKVDMEAWVLCISMSDAKLFGPYLPTDAMRDLCLIAQGKKALEATLSEAENSNPDFADIKTLLDCAEIRTDTASGTVAYFWESTKWYDDFPEVRFIIPAHSCRRGQ